VILAAVKANVWLGFAAATTLILGRRVHAVDGQARRVRRVANREVAALTDVNRREFWLLGVVAAAVLAMGLYPKPFVDVMHVSVTDLLTHVEQSKLPQGQP
jgi:NADH-quinone oxidoreductase subunit M